MAQAKQRPNTPKRTLVAVAAGYCADAEELDRLCEQYGDLPDDLAGACFERMKVAKRRALRFRAATMEGVAAKARMVAAGELFDVDPLIASTIRDLLAVIKKEGRVSCRRALRRPVDKVLAGGEQQSALFWLVPTIDVAKPDGLLS